MAQQTITSNAGQPLGLPNTGVGTDQGDTWDAAVVKINAMFTEQYGGNLGGTSVGFFGKTPVSSQPASSAEALVTSTPPTTSNFGYSLAQATALLNLVNEMRNVLVNYGLMKGSA